MLPKLQCDTQLALATFPNKKTLESFDSTEHKTNIYSAAIAKVKRGLDMITWACLSVSLCTKTAIWCWFLTLGKKRAINFCWYMFPCYAVLIIILFLINKCDTILCKGVALNRWVLSLKCPSAESTTSGFTWGLKRGRPCWIVWTETEEVQMNK